MSGKLTKLDTHVPAAPISRRNASALIAATLHRIETPLLIADNCQTELQSGFVRQLSERALVHDLPAAKSNHTRMLKRVVSVEASHRALLPIVCSGQFATPEITGEMAHAMLSLLFRGAAKPKNVETAAQLAGCLDLLSPSANALGKATGLWRPVPRHPVVLALAVRKLIAESVFVSTKELRVALHAAHNSVLWLAQDCEKWLALLRLSDRVLFEHDRAAWHLAYAEVGSDVVRTMQESNEAPYDEDDESEPPSPRWLAQEAMRLARGGD